MRWKTFALLESSFCVLLSVLAIILMGFVLVASGTSDGQRILAWLGIVEAVALTLVAHGQLIGSFRRRGKIPVPQTGSIWIPVLAVAVLLTGVALVIVGASARWVEFARVYLTYSIVPPTVLALLFRVMVVRSLRRLPGATAL